MCPLGVGVSTKCRFVYRTWVCCKVRVCRAYEGVYGICGCVWHVGVTFNCLAGLTGTDLWIEACLDRSCGDNNACGPCSSSLPPHGCW